jgi:hypothetical protein
MGIGNRLRTIAGAIDYAANFAGRLRLSVLWAGSNGYQRDAPADEIVAFHELFDVPAADARDSLGFDWASVGDVRPDSAWLADPQCHCREDARRRYGLAPERLRGWIFDRPWAAAHAWPEDVGKAPGSPLFVHAWYSIAEACDPARERPEGEILHGSTAPAPGPAFVHGPAFFRFYRSLRPAAGRLADAVKAMLRRFAGHDVVGVHVRTKQLHSGAFNATHTELLRHLGALPASTRFFVASDDAGQVDRVASAFPGRVLFHDWSGARADADASAAQSGVGDRAAHRFDCDGAGSSADQCSLAAIFMSLRLRPQAKDRAALQSAVVDMFTLAGTKRIIANTLSSFSIAAARIGGLRWEVPPPIRE